MKTEIKIYEQGLEEYPKTSAVIGNLFMILWIALGAVACWLFYPLIAWIYLAFAVIMVFVVLRKLVCPNCYYYDKWCNIGWGKLCALFFKKGDKVRGIRIGRKKEGIAEGKEKKQGERELKK